MTDHLLIPPRFCGPPGSGNGGYVCGRIAAYVSGPVTVTLRRPPPLATPVTVARDASVRVYDGALLIAEAAPARDTPAREVPGPAGAGDADVVPARYFDDPLFPGCFVCGPDRQPGDGLRIFPGAVTGLPLWAAPWTPEASVAGTDGVVRPELVWAALDCPSGIAVAEASGLDQDTAILLGQMTAHLAALPAAGDQCRVIAWAQGREGRKLTAGSALVGPGGEVLAAARTVWLTVPRPGPVRLVAPRLLEPAEALAGVREGGAGVFGEPVDEFGGRHRGREWIDPAGPAGESGSRG